MRTQKLFTFEYTYAMTKITYYMQTAYAIIKWDNTALFTDNKAA
jgi:hypothetical protein